MFGNRFTTYGSPYYTQTTMLPYEIPMTQSLTQSQTFTTPISPTLQPFAVPTPIGVPYPQPILVPVDRPCAVPVPQAVPVPVDRPCAVPVPYPVSVPQPVPVPQPYLVQEQVPVPYPVPVAVPVQVPQDYGSIPTYRNVEYIIEEPVRIVRRCRRRRRRCRSYCCTPAPPAPIIIPYPVQAPAPQPAPSYQVIEYIQDIYPPAQVFTQQVPVGYVVKNTSVEQPGIVQSQSNPGIILPSASSISPSTSVQQQQLVQQLPTGQFVQRPLSVGGGGVQHVVLRQPNVSSTNSGTLFSAPSYVA